jgi:DNA (cytosine-5)-methyltransferase 1
MRTLGGLFSGIGGFELAWQRAGGRVAWMCEIDPAARKVLQSRFPGVPVYPDVSQLDPAEVEPVDVLTGGSPCQGFSIAGARTGLEHVESRLFADYVRIMDGLAARGLSYAVWENVPGVLSITNDDGERTFPHVVAALVGADRPVQLDGRVRWNTGMAARGSRAVAWRVVDSRHFGVPQRRRRVYACVAFGGAAEGRAFGALLAKPEGVSGDLAACRTAREDVAGGVGAGAAGSFTFDRANVTSRLNRTQVGPGVPVGTLGAGTDHHAVVPATLVPQSFNWQQGDAEYQLADDAHTLGTTSAGRGDGGPAAIPTRLSRAIDCGSGSAGGNQGPTVVQQTYGVRRLTPVECERLQAFPDGWTDPAGSDSARYRPLGNAVTVNVPAWLFSRLTWDGKATV